MSGTVPSHAKHVSFSQYGEADVLTLAESPVPVPGPGQVLLRVRAAGVNPLDWKIRHGFMAAVFPVSFPHVLGLEASGEVVATGPDVTAWTVGDQVFGPVVGGYAEYAVAEAAKLAAKPAGLDWAEAAAVPVAAEASTRALALLGLSAGETLLVHGAAGAAGRFAVQFAVDRGVTVVGTASGANQENLRALGATPVDYAGDGVFDRIRAAAPQGVDAVLDAAGSGVLAESVALVGGPERVVSLVDPAEAGPLGVTFTGGQDSDHTAEALAAALVLHRAGTLSVPVRAALPLADAPAAHRLSEQRHGTGKIVLLP